MNTQLELKLLRTFCVVADELHFRRAAERLGATQSGVSQQVQELERRVGASLLERSRGGVRLTDAGRGFWADAHAVLARAEAAAATARDVAQGRRGEITLGLIGAATFEAMPRLLDAVQQRSPGLTVRFREMTAKEQMAALRSGDGPIDAGLLRAEARASGLSFRTVLSEPVVCLLPDTHRLASKETVALGDLEGEAVLNLSRDHDPAGHDFYLNLYRGAGFEPNVVMEVSQVATILFAIAATGCVALGPAGWRVLRREGVVLRPLSPPVPVVETRLVWNPNRISRALKLLIEAAKDLPRPTGER